MQPQKPLIEQTARTTPLQPLSNNITIQRTNYNLWTASQQQKNVDLTIRKSLRKAQKSQNYSPTRPSNNVLMQRLINLWDALQCPQQERDYAYSEILKEPALANDYARTMRQILFHRRRFQELETERTQLAENVRTTLQAGRGSKRALLADLIKLRVMTLELFSLMNSARRFSARPIDLPTLEVLEFSQIKRIFSEGILSRENLSVAFCVMRFIDGNYDEVSAQVNDVFDQLIVQGTNDEEIQVAFLLGSPILESQIPSQFQKFLVRKFDEIFEVKLEKYEPKDYVKPSQVLEMIKGETKGYNQYIRLIQQLQAKEMEICTVPIHHSEKSYDAYSVSVEYLKDIPAEEVKQVRKNFTKQLQSKFNEKSQSQIDDRILQLSQNSKMQQQQVYRPVLKVRNDNVIKKQEYEQKRESEILIKEEIQADVPMTLEAPPHDEFDEFPADVPTTLELKPQEEDDFEDTPQHVPATLEEPMHDDQFDDAPAVDSRQFVQNMPSPFEYNNDDIIAYAVDTGNSNSVANLITEAPADEYDFEETPADVPMTLEAPPHDEFDEFPADVPTTLELKPQEEDDFEDTPQHVPATLEEPMHDDEFDDAPAVDSRQFVQNMPSPFEYNNDDIIAYAVDTGNSNSVANLITEAPADEYDFEETPADVPMTLEAPPHDEFDEFPADVPTTLELKPQEEDDFEDTPQHVPATLEEPMHDDEFDDAPAVDSRQFVQNMPSPFEYNNDDIIAYAVDTGNSNSVANLITEAPADEYDFEETPADVPMTLEAPPHDEFDEFPADVPTTLELKPQEEDDFEDTPQHVPATLEEPMHDDEFDDAPAVDSRQFVQNMPSPFEYNNDDIIAYAVDTGNSNSVANLITEAPADEYDFEETPADVPMTLEAPPHDEFDEFPADVPTTLELKPQEEDDFEDTPQHVPATLEETMQEIYTSPFTFIINETEFI